jgi:hypothetical protein
MAWSNSKIFTAFITDALNNTAALDLDTDTITVALYDNDITPSQTVASASTAYAAGVWTTSGASGAEEVYSAGQWAQGGVNLASKTSTFASNVYTFDAADTASGSAATLTNVFGCLIYENTLTTPVADQGICYNYFGGGNSVTSGLFTVIWNASGIFTLTV